MPSAIPAVLPAWVSFSLISPPHEQFARRQLYQDFASWLQTRLMTSRKQFRQKFGKKIWKPSLPRSASFLRECYRRRLKQERPLAFAPHPRPITGGCKVIADTNKWTLTTEWNPIKKYKPRVCHGLLTRHFSAEQSPAVKSNQAIMIQKCSIIFFMAQFTLISFPFNL
jgi:hypothetical protein